jgi:thiol-disulfide isomerase/thioredoxin
MQKLLFILFYFITGFTFSQSDCFKDCQKRSTNEWNKLVARGVNSTDSALLINHKILADLKGCGFPAIELNKLDSGKLTINELKGNIVFVHFWFTACATCIAEMPSINKLQEEYKNEKVKFLAISFNDKNTLTSFFQRKGPFESIQTYIDQKTLESEFCILDGYPLNLILDKNGKVIDAWYEENPDAAQQENFYSKVKMLIKNNL